MDKERPSEHLRSQELIRAVLSDKKLMNSRAFSDKIYKDEPIIRTAGQMLPSASGKDVPPELRELAAAVRDPDKYMLSSPERMYMLGKITENYEDDYEPAERFERYYPSYDVMNTGQLRTFFSWRTCVRKGEVKNIYPSYYYLYLYELINQIGVSDPEDGYKKLVFVWKGYSEYDRSVYRKTRNLIRDYVVYYGLDKSLIAGIDPVENDEAYAVVTNNGTVSDDELFRALCTLASYRTDKSDFIKKYESDYINVVCSVYRKLCDYYLKHRTRSFPEKLFGVPLDIEYTMFYSMIFRDVKKYTDYVCTLSEKYYYTCRDGKWRCFRCSGCQNKNDELYAVLKNTESMMREKYDFPAGPETEKMSKTYLKIIDSEISRVKEENKRKEANRIVFDLSALDGIRRSADNIMEKLITEEEEYIPEDQPVTSETESCDEVSDVSCEDETSSCPELTDAERYFAVSLLKGEDYRSQLRSYGLQVSIVSESVNEKFFDVFGDTVIDFNGDEPFVIEDYSDELKGILGI